MADHFKVKTLCRVRPFLPSEMSDDGVQVSDGSISVVNPRDPTQRFKFNFSSAYGQDATQDELFDTDVHPLLDYIFTGLTVTIFAYGVTSSGKTHTVQGSPSSPGIIPRVINALFKKKARIRRLQVDLSVTYMEIYKDEVYDLLVPRENAPKLSVRENDEGKVVVANLTEKSISSCEEFEKIFSVACKSRSVGSTNLNHASSRSHAALAIKVSIYDPQENTVLTGQINLVDLAGSENNKLTGNDPIRMAESAAINKSLSVLGQVVHAINQGSQRIPYRDSKLTRILQDSLGGSSICLLICNLAPGAKFRQDTLNTLNFATRTKEIENRPIVNERDTRPMPKPHFAALAPPRMPSARPSIGRPSLSSSSSLGSGRQSIGGRSISGPEVITVKKKPELRRVSFSGMARASADCMEVEPNKEDVAGWGLTKEEIEKKISEAVEAEVARRLEEALKQALPPPPPPPPVQITPPGMLTPFIKKTRELDDEYKIRLEALERKYERGCSDLQVAAAMSPVTKKKTAKAFVVLARSHQDNDDLQVALELYSRAQSYAPDNDKLRSR
ncbi:hypothetical protein BOTBODRAFT_609753 [Botryobasidium botryosum FD-172 SS1]|uniref:Kinesin-like protein n=1 Tax=Botryobasidium botryosum (strain FD-172 SS1) TaxID=930990 RepID=A0A067LW83_BOTB1|nr:hypothetical protein BOTBODRAFT_609753 [Botryobasidium botryosum FD-172 SS1]